MSHSRCKTPGRSSFVAILIASFLTIVARPAHSACTNCLALGTGALASVTSASDDTAFGVNAMNKDTTGGFNTATGFEALFSNLNGVANTATGVTALQLNTSGDNNTATGASALLNNKTGGDNTATGSGALFSNADGNSNTATGSGALGSSTTGSNNTADGENTLFSNMSGGDNTASGVAALFSNSSGHDNTANGISALENNTTGSDNIAVGSNAGANLTTGDHNIDIFDQGVAGESNTIRIGTQGAQTITFIAGIANNSFSPKVSKPVYIMSNGQLGIKGKPSSARFKKDIHDMGDTSDNLMKLRPVTFRYRNDASGERQFGLVAEEVEAVYPEMVTRDEKGQLDGVLYEDLPVLMLNELKKQAAALTAKDAEIAALRSELNERVNGLVVRLESLESACSRKNKIVGAQIRQGLGAY